MRQECKGADGMVTAAAPGAEQCDFCGPTIKCRKEGELGVSCIFIGWETRHSHTGRLKFVDVSGAQRIKIADYLVEWQAERCRVSGTAIGGDYETGITPPGPVRIEQRRVGSIAPRKNQRAHRYLAHYRAGYTCVLPSPA
jgi:hypothetical protein